MAKKKAEKAPEPKEMKAKTHSDIYDEQIKAHEKTLEQYKKELADTDNTIKDKLK